MVAAPVAKAFLDWEAKTVELASEAGEPIEGEVLAHQLDLRSVAAVNTALASGRPLLVRGEPGVGKSQLARAVAQELGRVLLARTVDARTEARDLCWGLDNVARLAKAQMLGASSLDRAALRVEMDMSHFVVPGVLWWAYDWRSAWAQTQRAFEVVAVRPVSQERWEAAAGAVVLVDEIDKADSSVPNGLLEAFGEGCFAVPSGCGQKGGSEVRAARKPLVVVTTNEERALPDAFLRRCVVLQLALPSAPVLAERGRAHFPELSEEVLHGAAELLFADRQEMERRELSPPGQAEYLDLLRAVHRLSRETERDGTALLAELKEFVFSKHPDERER